MYDEVIARRSWVLIFNFILLLFTSCIIVPLMAKVFFILPKLDNDVFLKIMIVLLMILLLSLDIFFLILIVTIPTVLIRLINGKLYIYPKIKRCFSIDPAEISYISERHYGRKAIPSVAKLIIESKSGIYHLLWVSDADNVRRTLEALRDKALTTQQIAHKNTKY